MLFIHSSNIFIPPFCSRLQFFFKKNIPLGPKHSESINVQRAYILLHLKENNEKRFMETEKHGIVITDMNIWFFPFPHHHRWTELGYSDNAISTLTGENYKRLNDSQPTICVLLDSPKAFDTADLIARYSTQTIRKLSERKGTISMYQQPPTPT